jgi:hypothetical protein
MQPWQTLGKPKEASTNQCTCIPTGKVLPKESLLDRFGAGTRASCFVHRRARSYIWNYGAAAFDWATTGCQP